MNTALLSSQGQRGEDHRRCHHDSSPENSHNDARYSVTESALPAAYRNASLSNAQPQQQN
jgi:hypothetical protein